jgi:uncharacterized membrane protein (DUF4010 family)
MVFLATGDAPAAAPFWLLPGPFLDVGLALVLGLLVGAQRQLQQHLLAGVRTFALITLFGAVCALLAPLAGGWILAAGVVSLAISLLIGNLLAIKQGATHPGITTEVSALVMFVVGALVVSGQREVGAAVGVSVAVLLQAKRFLHAATERMGEKDVRAIITFALLTFVILPLAPNQDFGPFGVLNPHHIWLMVVLVVGISLGGYLVYKFAGARVGIVIGGVLGGLISSTATTATYSKRTRGAPNAARAAAVVLLIATCVMYARVLALVFIVARRDFVAIASPIGALMLATIVVSVALYIRSGRTASLEIPEPENPTELKFALFFGFVYGVVLLLIAIANRFFGDAGMYAVAAISGLSDMDAITLSAARLASAEQIEPRAAWRIILLGAASNMVAKGVIVATLGDARLRRLIFVSFGALIVVAGAIWFAWPIL